jgi:hypothetical protein
MIMSSRLTWLMLGAFSFMGASGFSLSRATSLGPRASARSLNMASSLKELCQVSKEACDAGSLSYTHTLACICNEMS